ncbi:hypothetical protein ScPMuIL_015228 [Solemya velum]
MFLVTTLALFMPLSLSCWILNLLFSVYNPDTTIVAPWRLIVAIFTPCFIASWGLKRGSLDKSGAIAGLFVGFVLSVSSMCFWSALLTFFIFASKATKFRSQQKRKFEEDFKEGGQRNWVQVLCNGGIAAEFSMLYMLDCGCVERPVDFSRQYMASWHSMAVLAALACSSGDTFASELGTVIGTSMKPRLITTLQKVPTGTNGGVTLVGTLSSVFGGFIVGLAYYITMLLACTGQQLQEAPSQWPIVVYSAACGAIGSIIDSYMGAILQYSGINEDKKCIVERPGPNVTHICGNALLDNHSVNLLSALFTALLGPRIAFYGWQYFV